MLPHITWYLSHILLSHNVPHKTINPKLYISGCVTGTRVYLLLCSVILTYEQDLSDFHAREDVGSETTVGKHPITTHGVMWHRCRTVSTRCRMVCVKYAVKVR